MLIKYVAKIDTPFDIRKIISSRFFNIAWLVCPLLLETVLLYYFHANEYYIFYAQTVFRLTI